MAPPSMQDSSKPASPSDFHWYNSKGDDEPMEPSLPIMIKESSGEVQQDAESGMCSVAHYVYSVIVDLLTTGLGHSWCSGWGGKMAEALVHEKADKHGNPMKQFMALTACSPRKSCQSKKQCTDTTEVAGSSDEEDRNYKDTKPAESESASPSESDSLCNAEACSLHCDTVSFLTYMAIYLQVTEILPFKTVPTVRQGASRKCMHSKPAALPSFEIQPISCTESLSSNKDTPEKSLKVIVCLHPL